MTTDTKTRGVVRVVKGSLTMEFDPRQGSGITFTFSTSKQTPTERVTLEHPRIKQGTPLPKAVKKQAFELKGLVTRGMLEEFSVSFGGVDVNGSPLPITFNVKISKSGYEDQVTLNRELVDPLVAIAG